MICEKTYRHWLFLLFLMLSIGARAQSFTHEWSHSIGGIGFDQSSGVAVDASGNSYVTGWFENTVDFDPGPNVFNLTADGENDVFIQKLDAQGNFLWALSFGGPVFDLGHALTVNDQGEVCITGWYSGTVDFDPGAGVFNLTANQLWDAFILKLDANGNFLWAVSMGGIDDDSGYDIEIDALGNVYTIGTYSGTSDFDPGPNIFNLTQNGPLEIFIQKLDSQGNFIWAKSFGGAAGDIGNAIALDDVGNIYATGIYSDVADFDPSANVVNLSSNGGSDIFVLKLDTGGNLLWAESIGSTQNDVGVDVQVDNDQNIVLLGTYVGYPDVDPGLGTNNLDWNGGNDIAIVKLSPMGNLIWAKSFGGPGSDNGTSIDIDNSGNIYATGSFEETVDFDPNAGSYELTSLSMKDIFVLALDNAGELVCARSYGSISNDEGISIKCGSNYKIYVTGTFDDDIDFAPNTGSNYLTSNGSGDAFVIQLDALGCFSAASSESLELRDWSVHPNPTTGLLTIQFRDPAQNVRIEIADSQGRLVDAAFFESLQETEFNLDLAVGIYYVTIIQNERRQIIRCLKQ